MTTFQCPAWPNLAREKLPAARATQVRELAKQRAAEARVLEMQTLLSIAGRGRKFAARRS